ncbi:MAG: hypothetical protein QM731_11055 [Chitinophagaceae bacterium]
MKFSVLLTHYFYKYKNLSLPGIGTFSIDNSFTIPDVNDKNFRDTFQHIQFVQKNTTQPDEALIDFIRTQTGKIKPLAYSDLESFVADGKLLLNIGKPFHIEGIGTLQKNRKGDLDFTPGEPLLERMESTSPITERETESSKRKAAGEPVIKRSSPPISGGNQRPLLVIGGIVVALGIIIWGGYSLYNKNTEPAVSAQQDTTNRAEPLNMPSQDSLTKQQTFAPDSAKAATSPAPATPAGNYKYILETTRYKTTALKRWNLLKPRVNLESATDSSFFKIVMVLPGTPADTARIKDSLHNWYWGSNRIDKTIAIEH